jgi:hypothetical protein
MEFRKYFSLVSFKSHAKKSKGQGRNLGGGGKGRKEDTLNQFKYLVIDKVEFVSVRKQCKRDISLQRVGPFHIREACLLRMT